MSFYSNPSQSHVVQKIECPICGSFFRKDIIEEHASSCTINVEPSIEQDYELCQPLNIVEQAKEEELERDKNEQEELIFQDDDVYIHPSGSSADYIAGCLQLVRTKKNKLLICWLPVDVGYYVLDLECTMDIVPTDSDTGSSISLQKQHKKQASYQITQYVEDIHSIRKHVPHIGYSHIVIALKNGVAVFPLYFHSGFFGLKKFIACLGDHFGLIRQPNDHNLYIPEPLHEQENNTSLSLSKVKESAWGFFNAIANKSKKMERVAMDNKKKDNNFDYNNVESNNPNDVDDFEILEMTYSNENGRRTSITDFAGNTKDSLEKTIEDFNNKKEDEEEDEEPPMVDVPKRLPMTLEMFNSFMNKDGLILDPKSVKAAIFSNGIEKNARKEIWKFLCEYYSWDSTAEERKLLEVAKKEEYNRLKIQWKSISMIQESRFRKFRDRRHRIEKDVRRTDRFLTYYSEENGEGLKQLFDILLTYTFYNFDLSYVQGMSDLLSPILYIMRDEVASFWSFAGYMEYMENHFHKDQNGVHSYLRLLKSLIAHVDPELFNFFEDNDSSNFFFCFRWILVNLKREFSYDDIQLLWEVLWTHHLSNHYIVFICTTIFEMNRKKILKLKMDFDQMLRFVNDLANNINLEVLLMKTEQLFYEVANDDLLPESLYELLSPYKVFPSHSKRGTNTTTTNKSN